MKTARMARSTADLILEAFDGREGMDSASTADFKYCCGKISKVICLNTAGNYETDMLAVPFITPFVLPTRIVPKEAVDLES
jgi:hypothetical protein